MKLAITGGTGLVGQEVLAQAKAAGHDIVALTRSPQPEQAGITWVEGDLDDTQALDRLVAGVDAVIHSAGLVNAPNRAGFEACNARGTENVIEAMERQHIRRLIHVSSLAAREPLLSDYGWSKAEAERHVLASHLDWTMVRPPAIYGPNDKDMHELFVMAKWGVVMLPPGGRLSIIAVADLARLLVRLAEDKATSLHKAYEVDDGTPRGWSQSQLAHAIGAAVGRKHVLPLHLPTLLVKLGARIDRLFRGKGARLTPDRACYMCHPDWVSRPELFPPAELWKPQTPTALGLAATARAYRLKGWL